MTVQASRGDSLRSPLPLSLIHISQSGKEATVTLLSSGDFVGESALAAIPGLRLSTATALCQCTALKIAREEMIHVMHQEHAFSDLFLKFLLERSMRTQADLVDQLFNNSEKRLARILLLMAEFGAVSYTHLSERASTGCGKTHGRRAL